MVYEKQTKEQYIAQLAESRREFESKEVSPFFRVRYESFNTILAQFENRKNDQIQYIGDIRYTKKEYDPCGYSKIILKDETDAGRAPFVIFDENAEVMDQTAQSFDIIAGDERKTVSITVENLSNKGVPCTGVLLPAGQKHDEPQRVFLMDSVLVPAPAQEGDNDVYADESISPSEDVSDVQGLVIGEDYEYVGENKLRLKLHYWYNKTFLENSIEFGQRAANQLWLLNYFWLSERNAQTYFVPISTCRYPNQIARIRVFPDVEWELNLFYNTRDPVWYGEVDPNYKL